VKHFVDFHSRNMEFLGNIFGFHDEWLIICCFTSHSRIFHLYGDVTIAGERL
jgi:hypothetical protein